MSFGIQVITDDVCAVTNTLEKKGIAFTFWNPEAFLSREPSAPAELSFETQQDMLTAQNLLGLPA